MAYTSLMTRSGSLYEGDSFGFHSYIATDEERPCTERCFCHQHDVSKTFSFLVHKSSSKMDITIFSNDLFSKLHELLHSTGWQIRFINGQRIANGLNLLKHYHILKSHLDNLASELPDSPPIHTPFSEMELLVDGLLADGEVFKSFGYEDLCEHGFLSFKTWKKFQQDKLQREILALEEGFWEVDSDLGELPTPPMQRNSSGQQSTDSEFAFDAPDDFEESPESLEHPQPGETWSTELENTANPANNSEELPTFAQESSPLLETWFEFPLIHAARAGQIELVRSLLDQGANINQGGLISPLSEATRVKYTQMVYSLRKQESDMNSSMSRRTTPLIEAASAGHLAVVQLLLDRGVDINKHSDYNSKTPLLAAIEGEHIAVVQLLLDQGVDINKYLDYNSKTPLLAAIERGYIEVVQLLLDQGVDINKYPIWNRETLLLAAVKRGYIAIVQLLLDRGADINKYSTWNGKTPLLAAAEGGYVEVVQLLLDRGADAHASGYMLWISRLAKAAGAGNIALKRLLQDRLIIAAASGQTEEMRALLQHGVDINAITPCGTALSTAVRSGYEFSVRWLLRKGADVHAAAAILRRSDDANLTIARLFKSEAWVRNIEYARNMRRSHHHDSWRAKNLTYLHSRFNAQHRLMIDATGRSSTEFRELSQTFPSLREAWSAGIRTLRSLCGGEPPRSLSDTIAFLCLAKAISGALQEIGGRDRSEQFLLDLDRWQLLFNSKADSDAYRDAIYSMWGVTLDENLLDLNRRQLHFSSQADSDAYIDADRDAVYSMWGVTLDENLPYQNQVNSEDLIYFQELASALVNQANESFDFDTLSDTGLESSQQRWQLRNDINPPSTNSSAIPPDIQVTVGTDAQPPEFVPPLHPDLPVHPSERSLQQAVAADVSSATIEPIVILLMAGMIFAIVVVFLHCSSRLLPPALLFRSAHLLTLFSYLGLGNISAGNASSPSIFAYIDTLQERCRLLEMYMGVKAWIPMPYGASDEFTCSGKGKGVLQPEDYFDFESYFA
jgi:ankyrin repeat protein